jgi:hypothetical protein
MLILFAMYVANPIGMSIDTIGPFDKSVEGHHHCLVVRHTQDVNDEEETTNGPNFLIILGMTTKAEASNAALTLINLLGAPKRIRIDMQPRTARRQCSKYIRRTTF